uniref:Peptidase S8/S53 domain-containing protein n=1 Tax=Panagrolaimus sp. PS1159 TaxID=55785 RepID=A0AC35EW49_9BILA
MCSTFLNEEIGNLINEMYNKYNILLFKSAGNNGPFYTSVGKIDSNVEDSVFKIGALLTSEMKTMIYYAQINITNPPLPIVYAFSSRGPGDNGSWGLDFVAPGAAISYVPQFASERKKCFDGTSYSTPNAAGAVACLLSALKANSIPYSPALIKFALFKTAFLPKNGNIFEFGHGIIEIDSAFDYYCKNVINFKSVAIRFKNRTGGITFTNLNEHPQSVMERSINLSDFINIENDTVEKWELQISQNAENESGHK